MSTYDLIAFDMDGTLLNSEKHVSMKTQRAIKKAVDHGKYVVLATGRSIPELVDCGDELKDIRYAVCGSGSMIYDHLEKKYLYKEAFPESVVWEIFKIIEHRDVMPYYFTQGKIITEKSKMNRLREYHMEQYRPMLERVCSTVDDAKSHYLRQKYKIEKFNLHCTSREMRDELLKEIKELPLTVALAEYSNIEMTPLGVSKASGLRRLCHHLNIPEDRIITVGDADNDMEMLRMKGLSVAMGNALPYIQDICDVIVGDNDHDGCVQAIEAYLLS